MRSVRWIGTRYDPAMPSANAIVRRQVQILDSPDGVADCVLITSRGEDMPEIEVQPGGGPTVRRMLVGAQLRRLRSEQGLSREEAGEAIRASEWKIHRLENGQVSFKERDIVDLLRIYGVTDPAEVAEFVILAREANAPGWWQHYGDILPQWFRVYVDLESAATLIRTYEGQFIPGLLQTEGYMRAVIDGAHLDDSPEEVDRRVRLRMGRQTLLTRKDAPRLWAVVDEAALRRPVGSREVMRGQLERLIDATKLPNVTLQVLPFGAGAHPAMVGSFSVLRFADRELPDVVYVEHLTSALYLNKRDEVDQYLHVMESICVHAAAPDETVELLNQILNEE
jgi:transcriptional regulator with XRE-family HTH domain